jgi:hypothetical protein
MLLRSGKKFTDPDDLLEALLFAYLKHDLFGVTKFVGRKSITPVYKERMLACLVARDGVGTLSTGPQENPKGAD